jgi:hypothetical protein
MPQGLILEFDGAVGREEYEAVKRILGVNAETGEGDWPAPLLYHAAGAKGDGWVVFEIWESRAAQEEFMARLARALGQAGLSAPSRVEWLELAADVNREG